jgi:small-conductance mechanosensitive channel
VIDSILRTVGEWITPERLQLVLRVGITIVVGLIVVRILVALGRRLTKRRMTPQGAMVVRKVILYTGFTLIAVNVLQQLGFKLTALLGAAGVVGIAVGFASQTSVSNLISGIFLISEKPFAVGDLIRIGGLTGVVQSIDLLSVKMRTLDNLFVRIPNQKLLNEEVTNITYFPIRRMDLNIGVAYKEDVTRVRDVLKQIADQNPLVLDEPEPLFLFRDFGDSALQLLFGVWFEKTQYLAVRNSLMVAIKERFDQEGIEIPFPHRTIYTGSVTDPFPVRVVEPSEAFAAPASSAEAAGADES